MNDRECTCWTGCARQMWRGAGFSAGISAKHQWGVVVSRSRQSMEQLQCGCRAPIFVSRGQKEENLESCPQIVTLLLRFQIVCLTNFSFDTVMLGRRWWGSPGRKPETRPGERHRVFRAILEQQKAALWTGIATRLAFLRLKIVILCRSVVHSYRRWSQTVIMSNQSSASRPRDNASLGPPISSASFSNASNSRRRRTTLRNSLTSAQLDVPVERAAVTWEKASDICTRRPIEMGWSSEKSCGAQRAKGRI